MGEGYLLAEALDRSLPLSLPLFVHSRLDFGPGDTFPLQDDTVQLPIDASFLEAVREEQVPRKVFGFGLVGD